jgi:hypothetical protein
MTKSTMRTSKVYTINTDIRKHARSFYEDTLLYDIQIIDFSHRKMVQRIQVMYVVSFKRGVFMKRLIIMTCVLSTTFTMLQGSTVNGQAGMVTSHTFFSARPNFQTAMPERVALFREDLYDECCGFGGGFQMVVYGGRITSRGSENLARFFLPGGCTTCCLNVQEYNPAVEQALPLLSGQSEDYDRAKDIEARNFNIVTNAATSRALPNEATFASRICFRPEQEKIGVGLAYRQVLTRKADGTAGFWIEGSLPIERIRNRVELRESIASSGGGPDLTDIGLDNSPHVANMTEAFAQKNWLYGKIDCRCERRKIGIADVELKVGYNTINCPRANFISFAGIIIPAGNRVRGRYLFEPIVGHNRHFGFMLGNTIAFALWRRRQYDVALYYDHALRFFFKNHQVRSFDLINHQWSRYQEVYSSPEQAFAAFQDNSFSSGTSGINIFTQCFNVKANLSGDWNTAFVLTRRGDCSSFQLELGYNLFARQSETVELRCCNPIDNIALKGIDGEGTTTLARNIKQNFRDSVVAFNNGYIRLDQCDVDYQSVAHPATISNIVYAAIGYKRERNCPWIASVGGSYEFANHRVNTHLDRWLIWGKFGFTF